MKDNLVKIIGVLLITGGVCVGIAWWVQKNSPPTDLASSLLKSFADKDTDHDGLSDNMESIYGTNYNDADSDGDGFLDGEEVLSGYDPMKPAPNDRLDSIYTIMPRPAAGSMKDLNFTNNLIEQITKKVVNGDIQPKKIGDITTIANPSSVEEAMQAAVQRSYQEFSLPDIPDGQLNISLDNSEEAIKEYAKEVSSVLTSINNVSTLDLDNEESKNIADLVDLCENTAAQIKKIKVPSDLAAVHKKQIGLLIMQANILKAIANAQNDPLKANIAIAQIKNANGIAAQIISGIKEAVEAHIQK